MKFMVNKHCTVLIIINELFTKSGAAAGIMEETS